MKKKNLDRLTLREAWAMVPPFTRTEKAGLWLLLIGVCCYLFLLNHVEPTEAGIARNRITGTMRLQQTSGWYVTWPWVSVARVQTAPMRVCITSATRAVDCRLVRFNASEYQAFVATEGFRYYWWANRFSINFGYNEEYRGFRDIMRGYAFSKVRFSFITILDE